MITTMNNYPQHHQLVEMIHNDQITTQQQLADVPLGQPRIRWWEINHDTPKVYKSLAAPSDDELVLMWWILSIVNLVDSIVVAIVFASIALARKRSTKLNPFNVYLLFLMFPDFLYSFLCFVTCLLCALEGQYYSSKMCEWQAVYLICATSANAWINAITTYEIHKLLQKSNRRERYFPPTLQQVSKRCLLAYLYSFGISVWVFIDGPWGLHDVDALYGFVCLPVQFTTGSNLFWYLLFVPLFMGIPLLYICWVLYDIYRNKLLPPTGKRRELTIYFFRLTFIFIAFWIPTILVYYIFRGLHPWGMFAFGVWTHSAGGVCAFFTCYKPDVGAAVRDLVRCKCNCSCSSCGKDSNQRRPLRRRGSSTRSFGTNSYDGDVSGGRSRSGAYFGNFGFGRSGGRERTSWDPTRRRSSTGVSTVNELSVIAAVIEQEEEAASVKEHQQRVNRRFDYDYGDEEKEEDDDEEEEERDEELLKRQEMNGKGVIDLEDSHIESRHAQDSDGGEEEEIVITFESEVDRIHIEHPTNDD